MRTMTVGIEDCLFFAYHGVMEQERRAGNDFLVSVAVTYSMEEGCGDELHNTISYADIYEVVKEVMQAPANLLETIAQTIGESLKARWPIIEKGEVKVKKITPPIRGFSGSAYILYNFF